MTDSGLSDDGRAYYRAKAAEGRDRRDFLEFLEEHEHVHQISDRDTGIDFYVGAPDSYPNHLRNDDHIRMIGRSSIATMQSAVPKLQEHRFITEVKVHLPAAPESMRDEIDDALEIPDDMAVHYGTGALGGMPQVSGAITPHILHTAAVTYGATRAAVETAIDAYVDVYDAGDRSIKEVPDR